MNQDAKTVVKLLKLLANENRLYILCVLMQGPQNVTSLCERLPHITQSALSQHLALMKAQGVLADMKKGQTVTYSIADSRVAEVIRVLKQYYCTSEGF